MTLDTNLNTPPYYDDFDANNNFHRILFKPSVALQARELTQLQTALQDQIEKFGKHIFKEGAIVSGVALNFDDQYNYVKIQDSYTNGASFDITSFIGYTVRNSNGVAGKIVKAIAGLQSNYDGTSTTTKRNSQLNTLYVKYSNTASDGTTKTFAAADVLIVETSAGVSVGNVTVSNSDTYPVGYGYAMSVSDGVIFQKGFFVTVTPQTVLVNNYFTTSDSAPDNVSVGFTVSESIITSSTDDTLLDNAFGAPNYAAPGADRLKLTATLSVRETNSTTNTDHFSTLVDFSSGRPIKIYRNEYSDLGDEIAKRTFEESGHYVVNPFALNVKSIASNTTNLNLEIGAGLGYVSGYRVEFLDKFNTAIRKGTDTRSLTSQILNTSIGAYVFIKEYAGEFRFDTLTSVELHNAAQTAVTSNATLLSTTYSSATKIGTANVIGIRFYSGVAGSSSAQFKLYLTNITMDSGYNFNAVKSVIARSGGSTVGIADVVLETDVATGTSIALLQEAEKSTLIYPFNQPAIKNLTNSSYTFRSRKSSGITFDVNGTATFSLPSSVDSSSETFPYGTGLLSEQQEGDFVVIASTAANTTAKTGTVAVNTTSSNVTGTSTSFLSDYKVGDFITVTSYGTRSITSITNNTLLTVTAPFSSAVTAQTHVRTFPAGAIIPFVNRPETTINIDTTTSATLALGTGVGGLSTTFAATVYYNTKKGTSGGSTAVQKSKSVSKNRFVKIDLSNNSAGVSGPWCLGLPDVAKINAIYLNNSSTYSNSTTDYSSYFTLDNGQRDGFYNLAYLKLNPNRNLNLYSSNTILIDLDHFTSDQDSNSKGYFNVQSYPVLDPTANSTTITTQEIPVFTSPTTGKVYDLRNSIDFRAYATNTAVSSSTVASATINPSTTVTFKVASTSSGSNSYIIAPDSGFNTDLNYYLARYDTVFISPQGKVVVLESDPADNPRIKVPTQKNMVLGSIYVTPYPSLDPKTGYSSLRADLAVNVVATQQRRFTMRDISTLKQRIENLEYYVSLTMLELAIRDLKLINSAGLDRFKNGFVVDSFMDFSVGKVEDPSFIISLDKKRAEIRAVFKVTRPGLEYSSTLSSNITKTGTSFTLPYTSVAYISQPYASKARNLNDLSIFDWLGVTSLEPRFGRPDINVPVEPPPPPPNTPPTNDPTTPGGGWDGGGGYDQPSSPDNSSDDSGEGDSGDAGDGGAGDGGDGGSGGDGGGAE